MQRENWNRDWYFWKVNDSFAIGNGIPESACMVNVPHDAMIGEKPFAESQNVNNTGFRDSSVYKYAKKLMVPSEEKDKLIFLKFGGVYMGATVYVNGQAAGRNMFGYSTFYVDLTPLLKYNAENLIMVSVRGAMKNSRWYSGAGIYRDVTLLKSDRCRIKEDSVQLTTLEADQEMAVLMLRGQITNQHAQNMNIRVSYEITDKEGNCVAKASFRQFVKEQSDVSFQRRAAVELPYLWSSETPDLYQCSVSLYEMLPEGEVLLDTQETAFGIRTIVADTKRGFRVNGKTVKLRGACIHHDSGLLGSATYETAQYRQIAKLKQAGFNAIRMAHHPIGEALLRACDHLGMYVMEETFDMWQSCKSDFDYGMFFEDQWRNDVALMVQKDYNHPSVVMYSVGNEIPEFGTDAGAGFCAEISDYIRSMDDTRLLTCGINGIFITGDHLDEIVTEILKDSDIKPSGTVNDYLTVMDNYMPELVAHPVVDENIDKICALLDVAGYNYMTSRYEADAVNYPDRVMVGSETYPPQIAKNWEIIKRTDSVIGDFTWTGWDYMGESGIGLPAYHFGEGGFSAQFPATLAYVGDIDITGFRRPMSYYRELVFEQTKTPYIAVQNPQHYGEKPMLTPWILGDLTASWTWPECEDKPVIVEVYSAGDEVELICNGVLLGRQPAGEANQYRAYFETTYQPGTLLAVSYEKGAEIGRRELKTVTGDTVLQVCVEDMKDYVPEQTTEKGILQYIFLSIVDTEGTLDYNKREKLKAEISGVAEWMVCGNADPRSLQVPPEPEFETFEGKAQIIVRKKNAREPVTLTIYRLSNDSVQTVTF